MLFNQQMLKNYSIVRKETIPPEHALYFVKALIALKHPRTKELFDFFLHNNAYYENRIAMVKEIVALNTDGNLTDYLIEVMVEFEEEYPDIKDIILKHI